MSDTRPPNDATRTSRVAVIGGGISGLAAAHRLVERMPGCRLTLFESAPRLGGVLETLDRDGFLIERSADSFITKLSWAIDLCRRIGIEDELLPTRESRRRALVLRRGRIVPIPEGFVLMSPRRLGPLMTSPLLSPLGKLRLACEPLVARSRQAGEPGHDESVASFATRRLGREVFERIVQPLVAGIYTADPARLSMAATMPQFLEQEREYGSLLRAALADRSAESNDSGARYGMFVAPRHGMSSFVAAIAARLPSDAVRLGSPVTRLARDGDRWHVSVADGPDDQPFDAVILATPAPAAARLLQPVAHELASELSAIEYAGASIVSLAYDVDQLGVSLDGFGLVVPQCEQRSIIAASFASLKFAGRAPEHRILVRVFLGGALQPGLTDLPDEQLVATAQRELESLLDVTGRPQLLDVARWPGSMPQYHVGHVERVARIESSVATLPGLELAGNAYRGVGIPQCIHSGEQAAERCCERVSVGW